MSAEPEKPSQNASDAKRSAKSEAAKSEAARSEAAKRKPMPFEPQGKAKQTGAKSEPVQPAKSAQPVAQASKSTAKRRASREGGIPDAVSRRMVKRIAWCSGVPTLLGMSTFVVSYFAVSNGVPLPTYAVLLVSLGWFGLGVLGVSYGVLSASWDEAPGSWLGWNELRTNWARLTAEWKANSEAARASRSSKK